MTPVAVATIGVFDGFHRGHRQVVRRARERADRVRGRLVVFTFDEHPEVVLRGIDPLPRLSTPAETAGLLLDAGADEVRFLRFDAALARKSPERFLVEHVFSTQRLAGLVVGYDFAMGRGRAGDPGALAALGTRLGFRVEAVPAAEDGGGPISSTRIRGALAEGRVAEAAAWLGRPYRLRGTVVAGEGRGRTLGFPTANLRVHPRKLRPRQGVYAVRVDGADLEGAPGVANLGIRPTFGEGRETVEVHLLEFRGDLLGASLTVNLVEGLRPEIKFKNAKELEAQIGEDATRARALLAAEASRESP